MRTKLAPRALHGLSSRADLRCQCGGVPELVQPDEHAHKTLVGVCACGRWTVFVQEAPRWRAATAFLVGFVAASRRARFHD
jgi:hypothetical protein